MKKKVFYYYNPDSNTQYGLLEVMPYERSPLIHAPAPESDGKFSYALAVNSSNQIIAGASGENSLTGNVYVLQSLK